MDKCLQSRQLLMYLLIEQICAMYSKNKLLQVRAPAEL